ncbi:MAG: RraA family protein [Rhodobacteraceae bacterium]|nr:RraA family protein [Paracoccaceae bacterium]
MVGFQILTRRRKMASDLVEKFREIPVANVSDVMNRIVAGGPRLRPYHGGGTLCGIALTVRTRPGDNLMAHAAITMAEPGDVIVLDGGGDLTNSLIGERMMHHSRKRGVEGWVVNGSIRDLGWLRETNFPVYAAGVTHRGPYKSGPGEINVRVAIEGLVIEPGDLILGDADGLVSVPVDGAEEIFAKAQEKFQFETETFAALGTTDQAADREKMFASLRSMGCFIEG